MQQKNDITFFITSSPQSEWMTKVCCNRILNFYPNASIVIHNTYYDAEKTIGNIQFVNFQVKQDEMALEKVCKFFEMCKTKYLVYLHNDVFLLKPLDELKKMLNNKTLAVSCVLPGETEPHSQGITVGGKYWDKKAMFPCFLIVDMGEYYKTFNTTKLDKTLLPHEDYFETEYGWWINLVFQDKYKLLTPSKTLNSYKDAVCIVYDDYIFHKAYGSGETRLNRDGWVRFLSDRQKYDDIDLFLDKIPILKEIEEHLKQADIENAVKYLQCDCKTEWLEKCFNSDDNDLLCFKP